MRITNSWGVYEVSLRPPKADGSCFRGLCPVHYPIAASALHARPTLSHSNKISVHTFYASQLRGTTPGYRRGLSVLMIVTFFDTGLTQKQRMSSSILQGEVDGREIKRHLLILLEPEGITHTYTYIIDLAVQRLAEVLGSFPSARLAPEKIVHCGWSISHQKRNRHRPDENVFKGARVIIFTSRALICERC